MASLIEFKLFAPYNKKAAVIGSFSDWQPVEMKKGDDGYFRTKIELKDGEYEYKFRVRSLSWFLEPDEWVEVVDPYAVNIAPESQNGTITIKDGKKIVDTVETNLISKRLTKMSIENRVEATAKNVEGKIQEAIGEVTGNPQDKTEGREKQAEAQVQHSVENVKDNIKKALD